MARDKARPRKKKSATWKRGNAGRALKYGPYEVARSQDPGTEAPDFWLVSGMLFLWLFVWIAACIITGVEPYRPTIWTVVLALCGSVGVTIGIAALRGRAQSRKRR